MGQVVQFKRRHFSGAVADMADVVNPAIGDKFFATDTFQSFFYTGAEWIRGSLEGMIDHTWEGDDADNREIDLGDDYDFILIFTEESKASTVDHLAQATAFKTYYEVRWVLGAAAHMDSETMAAANVGFQGKMVGGDSTKIKLGSTGNNTLGTNKSGITYRLIGFKFQDMV